MVNEEKVRLMAKAASYEKREGKKALSVNRMFRGDYISIHMIGAWLCYTIAFVIVAALWAMYKVEFLMDNINQLDFISLGKSVGILYISLLCIYLVINYIVFHLRYRRFKKGLAAYNHILKRLSHLYGGDRDNASAEAGGKGNHEDFS